MSPEYGKGRAEEARPRGKGKAEALLGAVLQQALSLLSGRKIRAAEELERISRAVRQTAMSFGEEYPEGVSRYAGQAAEQIAKASAYIREKDLMDFLRDAQDLAQRRPALAFGGGFAAGFVLARYFKASARDGRGKGVPQAG